MIKTRQNAMNVESAIRNLLLYLLYLVFECKSDFDHSGFLSNRTFVQLSDKYFRPFSLL